MEKRTINTLLAMVLICVMMLCACGQKNVPSNTATESSSEASPPVTEEPITNSESIPKMEAEESSVPVPENTQEVPSLTVVTGDSQEPADAGMVPEDVSYEGLSPAEVVEIFNSKASADINESIHMRMEFPGRYPDDHTDSKTQGGMREDRDDKGIDLVMWVDGLSKDVFLISMGDEEALDDYLLFLSDAKRVQTEYQKRISEYFPDITLRLRVIEDTESDGTLAVIEDGKIVYDTADAEELRQYLDIRDMLQGG